ncbi:MAG: hypothetical protein AAB449_02755 [Patescibacteria group bacterium]
MNDVQRLLEQTAQFNTVDIGVLKREDLGPFSFEDVFPKLKSLHSLLTLLSSQGKVLETDPFIPQDLINNLTDRLTEFNRLVQNIRDFDVRSGDPNTKKQSIANDIQSHRERAVKNLHPLFLSLQQKQIDPAAFASSVQGTRAEVEELLKRLKEKDEEASKALQGIKDISATAVAVKYSSVFEDQAQKHRTVAWRWFMAGCAVFVVLGGYLLYLLLHGLPVTTELIQTLRELSVRVLFLVVLYFALIQCVKNYNVNKHLQVVNEHRQNSLQTFEAFVSAAATDDVKGAVLLEATKSIFDPGKTGYLHKEGQVSYSFSIADLFKRS